MRFEKSIDIDAPQQRVWDVLSALEAWPQRIETVDIVELLTPAPITKGSRVRLKQPKLPEGTWDITVWDAPSYFEWTQKTGGTTSVAGHRIEALGEGRARLTLTLDMRGFLVRSSPCSTRPNQPLHDLEAGHEAGSQSAESFDGGDLPPSVREKEQSSDRRRRPSGRQQ
jgi:hypothetical protein